MCRVPFWAESLCLLRLYSLTDNHSAVLIDSSVAASCDPQAACYHFSASACSC